jgi:hypothetical protein
LVTSVIVRLWLGLGSFTMKKKENMKRESTSKTRRATISSARPKFPPTRQQSSEAKTTPFNWLVIMYAVLLVVHLIVFAVLGFVFPNVMVFGTHQVSVLAGLLMSSIVFTFLTIGAIPVIEAVQSTLKIKLSNMQWMVAYYVLDFVSLWVLARFAEQLGMGISSWKAIAFIAILFDCAQGLAITSLMKRMK